jgi:lysine biosynthesis protein LysW
VSKDNTTNCPQCGAVIEINSFSEEGELITCLHCDTKLRITKIYPLRVKMLKRTNEVEDDYMDDIEGKDEAYPDYDE